MLFTTPEQFVILAVLLFGGWLLGYGTAPSAKKWKRRVKDQSNSFTAYYGDIEDKLRTATQHVADLKAQNDALHAEQAAAKRTIAELRTTAMVPVAAEVAKPTDMATAPWPALALVKTPPAPEIVPPTAPIAADSAPETISHPPETTTLSQVAVEREAAIDHRPELTDAHATPVAETVPDEPAIPAPTETIVAQDAVPPPEETGAPAPAPIGPAEPETPGKGWFASSARDDLTRIRGIDAELDTRLSGLGVVRFEDLEKLSAEDEMALEQRLTLPVGYVAREQWRTQAALLRAGRDEEQEAHFSAVETPPNG